MVTSVSTNYCKIKWSWSGSNLKHSFLRVLEAKWSKIKVEPITSSNTGPFSGQQMRQSSICPKMYKRREGERDFWSFKQGYVFFLRASSSQFVDNPVSSDDNKSFSIYITSCLEEASSSSSSSLTTTTKMKGLIQSPSRRSPPKT